MFHVSCPRYYLSTHTYIFFRRNPRKLEYGADTRCTYCLSSSSSQWHRDKKMETFCSACYHYHNRHGKPRPLHKRSVGVISIYLHNQRGNHVCRRFYKKLEYGPSVRCDQCGTGSTSQWHRDQRGQTSCSACYHYTRRHGQPRPPDKRWVIELETNLREVSQ